MHEEYGSDDGGDSLELLNLGNEARIKQGPSQSPDVVISPFGRMGGVRREDWVKQRSPPPLI